MVIIIIIMCNLKRFCVDSTLYKVVPTCYPLKKKKFVTCFFQLPSLLIIFSLPASSTVSFSNLWFNSKSYLHFFKIRVNRLSIYYFYIFQYDIMLLWHFTCDCTRFLKLSLRLAFLFFSLFLLPFPKSIVTTKIIFSKIRIWSYYSLSLELSAP